MGWGGGGGGVTFDLSRTLKHGVLQPGHATLIARCTHAALTGALTSGSWKTAPPAPSAAPQLSCAVGPLQRLNAGHSPHPRDLFIQGRCKQTGQTGRPLAWSLHRPPLPHSPIALLSAEEKWGQKVPLGAPHNKTKAAQRSTCQPSPLLGVGVGGLPGS